LLIAREIMPETIPSCAVENQLAVNFGAVTTANLEQLRLLNQTILPVRYNDKFYQDILLTPETMTKFAYWNGFVVGSICSRLEDKDNGKKKAYIMTLGCLAAYRSRGIGTKLLNSVLEACEADDEIEEIYLHVQTSNADAINFYKRFEFEISDTIKNYYKRIEPPDCYILKRCFTAKDKEEPAPASAAADSA
jgi:ribosomal protein S18 acetylase RimI-like enzyme